MGRKYKRDRGRSGSAKLSVKEIIIAGICLIPVMWIMARSLKAFFWYFKKEEMFQNYGKKQE